MRNTEVGKGEIVIFRWEIGKVTLSLVEAKGGENLLPACRDFTPSQEKKHKGRKFSPAQAAKPQGQERIFFPSAFARVKERNVGRRAGDSLLPEPPLRMDIPLCLPICAKTSP